MQPAPVHQRLDFREHGENPLLDVGAGGTLVGFARGPGEPFADVKILGDAEIGKDPGVLGRVADAEQRALVCGHTRDRGALKADHARA